MGISIVSDALLHGLSWKHLLRVQQATGWSDLQLADRLGLTLREFYRKKVAKKPLMARSSLLLANELQIDLHNLFYGKLDFTALERHYRGDSDYLPARYQDAAFSRMRTSIHLLDYCDAQFGRTFTDQLLNSFQVKRPAFSDPNRPISIRFLVDTCDYLSEYLGGNPTLFMKIGMQSAAVSKRSPISAVLGQSKSVRELYDLQINSLMEHFDKNFHYRTIALTEDYCVIESTERLEAKEAFHGASIGSRLTCLTRVGVASAITGALDLPFGAVEKTHCIHQGDSRCLFRVDYQRARAHLRKAKQPTLQLITPPQAMTSTSLR